MSDVILRKFLKQNRQEIPYKMAHLSKMSIEYEM
jgi:hypothetical protein